MKHQKRWGLPVIWLLTIMVLPAVASATTYYVDDDGNDGNSGLSAAAAWKTISHAAGQIPAGTAAAPNLLRIMAGTYNPANGETFPIAFPHNYISLVGNGVASVTIDTGGAPTIALQMNGKGASVSGCTFNNATTGIASSQGAFTVTDSLFESTVDREV